MCSGDPTEVKICKTVFDYPGWRRWGECRKDLKRCHDELSDQEDDDKTLLPAKRRLFSARLQYKKHSCWDDCVYPSQCYHEEGGLTGTLSPIGEEDEEEYDGEELEEDWYLCEKEPLFDEEFYVEEEEEEEEENGPEV
jgi:hypothetical protein